MTAGNWPRGHPGRPAWSWGTAAERDAVVRLVAESRVTTVLGPGGMGKTRPAVAARSRPAGR